IFGWLILGEEIQVRSIVGSALILVGVYLVNLQARRRR
ncbi:EamA/RhaT family transporter, partial [Candidatus Bathyarchaeota archaeon]